ncbi:cilia- and flagella-associated protein 47-like [Nelusetta ayraudi]|uniref:cilia- and flagella-associated protein 47-like n=1 Tax=Nelusetta ayraudi TaxID=303726 RepID=UPI003F721588
MSQDWGDNRMAASCVRVDPPLVAFKDVEVGQVYKIQVTAANVGKTSRNILMGKPKLKLFKFTASSVFQFVAPGLSLSGWLEFTPEKDREVRDCLPIYVEDAGTIEVPLLGFPRACSLTTDSVLDFGCLAARSQPIKKHHLITNKGSASGAFRVQYSGDPLVSFFPSSGVIAAGATQWLRVELRTDRPGRIEENAVVILQNSTPIILSIKAEVEDQRLEIFDLQGTALSCLWFGPVYFGTSTVKKVVLRNNGPQPCDWVSLLQDKADGTEMGTDLQRRTDAALLERIKRCSPATEDVSRVMVCFPDQGHLGPYDKTTVEIRFSPLRKRTPGERKREAFARQQDYCLFLLFESVGSKHGFTHLNGKSSVELAVTGSGLPVSLVPSPGHRFRFPPCVTGQRSSLSCTLRNVCTKLPVVFRFRTLPHFGTEPSSGTIQPGQCREVVLSFVARQQGSFRARQKLDVLGFVRRSASGAADVPALDFCGFHTVSLHLSAVCRGETIQQPPKLNPGITPPVTNPAGLQPRARSSELALCHQMARVTVLCANKTRIHEYEQARSRSAGKQGEEEEFLAFPNDRATSLRPASADTQYRTIFTGMPRYRYMDARFSFTREERKQRWQHRQIYIEFIRQSRQARLQWIKDREQKKVENDVDIGIIPAQGLVPPKLPDLESSVTEGGLNYRFTSPVAQHQASRCDISQQADNQAVNAVPSTSQEMTDCNRTLTAQELYQVEIGPLLVDFGEVCAQSVCTQRLELTNGLPWFVWVQLEVDCPELRGSSPLSHVLAPRSRSTLPLTFQSSILGPFIRSLSYSVNQRHLGQVLIQARVVPLSLELSSNLLLLNPAPSLAAQSGYRCSVTLRNRLNHAAEFTWQPVVTESGILFSVRPATGVVDPYSELDCEVVWHPSFSSPTEGDFDLLVHNGNVQRLHCIAKVGSTQVALADKYVMFESVPLNMPSVKTAVLQNSGQNHAYYQVQDVCAVPGLVVTPSEGVVPSGGKTALQVHFNPESPIKFDTRIEASVENFFFSLESVRFCVCASILPCLITFFSSKIVLRSMKPTELRVRGSVEPPNINISVSHLKFHGVRAGSRKAIAFTLTNCSPAAAWVAFDLSQYADFSLQLPQPSAVKKKTSVSIVEVQANQSVDCSLVFSPTQRNGRSHCDINHWLAKTRFQASHLVSQSATC